MAVTLDQITKWLEEKEVNFHHDTEDEVIIFTTSDGHTKQFHFIRARENGDIFEWKMQILDENKDRVMIKDHQYLEKVLSHMLYLNYTTKFGTWEYDPSDGDFFLTVEIPLEDALMTKKQFNRIADYMIRDGQRGADDIRHILSTGEVPQDSTEEDMIAQLKAMLAQLKGESSSDSTADGI
jgi:hypothetical protein